jgi:hypothetical protein
VGGGSALVRATATVGMVSTAAAHRALTVASTDPIASIAVIKDNAKLLYGLVLLERSKRGEQ